MVNVGSYGGGDEGDGSKDDDGGDGGNDSDGDILFSIVTLIII